MKREVELSGAIFDLPKRNWFFPAIEHDFSARHFSHLASTPVGPAAGPHTQLAQNIVLSWLAGARILELKTVQVNDHLQIPRPCIHVPNVGYNVEWSQELNVPKSLLEYAKAVYLIEILKQTNAFGAYPGSGSMGAGGDTVFDVSVGYDCPGIQSAKVTGFLRSIRNTAPDFDELRQTLTGDCNGFRELQLPSEISNCVTLSTFHGCPAEQIEAMVCYLLEDLRFNVIVKFNPTLLGYDAVREILIDRLGYRHLELCREAFDADLQYDTALEMMGRLHRTAQDCGLGVGAKFTNTLVVANNPTFFPTQTEPYMYLSGQPLHVLAMNLMQRFREDLGTEIPISFSAGINRKNFTAAVACGMVPVTTCTDLLRPGGYSRLPRYLATLAEEMDRCKVTSREAFVLAAHGHGAEAVRLALRSSKGGTQVWDCEGPRLTTIAAVKANELPAALRRCAWAAGLDVGEIVLQATRIAGRLNGREIVPQLASDPAYHASSNRREPRQIDRELGLYDCSNCDLCISACPNDAIFAYETTPLKVETERLQFISTAGPLRAKGAGYTLRKSHQIAVADGLCNECSNCDVYCPEHGAPYRLKEHVFASLDDFRAAAPRDGFCRSELKLYARLGGTEWIFAAGLESNDAAVSSKGRRLDIQFDPFELRTIPFGEGEEFCFDTAVLWRMKTVWECIFQSRRPNAVNPNPSASPKIRSERKLAPVRGGKA
jgi:putative selenate reductase